MSKKAKAQASIEIVEPLRLDFGCGQNKKPGFVGVDKFAMPGVDYVLDIGNAIWPWPDSSAEEAHASHFLEHLTNQNGKNERVHFFNELYRVLKPGAKATLIFPHWNSNRYYGDPTHKEPFSEMGFYYLSREWRKSQAPHTDAEHNPNGYSCDFEAVWGYSMHASLAVRNAEYQQFAMTHYLESRQDVVSTCKARKG